MDVACLFVRDFLVALARRDNPRLARRPVVIGGSPDEHAQVVACSPEAAAAGVTVGTTLRRALALCHDAVFLPRQEGHARAEAALITDLLGRYSPVIEAIAPGHVHFEVRGLARMTGVPEEAYLRDLHDAVCEATRLPVAMGVAETVFAAHASAVCAGMAAPSLRADVPLPPVALQNSRSALPNEGWSAGRRNEPAGNGQQLVLVPRGASKEHIARLPVEVLPVSPLMHQKLRLFGLERAGQVAELGFSAVQAQFGPEGARAWELANGKDDSRIVPRREELRVDEEMELPAPTALSEPLVVGTRALLQRALNHRDIRGQSLRRLDWRLGLESGEQVQRKFVFREPTHDLRRMLFVVRQRIERLQLASAATSLGVTLSGVCSEYGHQANLWPVGPRRQKELIEAVEQLTERTGEPQVFRIVEVQPWSRIPERQLALVAFGP
ncbi:MAG: DNA polymerase Y family protein [Hyphomicrobiales bacterium]